MRSEQSFDKIIIMYCTVHVHRTPRTTFIRKFVMPKNFW